MTVSLHIIALNEESALPGLLQDVVVQNYPHEKIEVVLVNSASTDATRSIMDDFAAAHTDFLAVRVVDNPKRFTPCAWNTALSASTADIVIHLDAHARIPEDFVAKNVTVIQSGKDICGGVVRNFSAQKTRWIETVNQAEEAMFGGSIAAFRHSTACGYVSTLAFAAYRKEVFEAVGTYDERLLRSEDNEMHQRMREHGYRFYYTPDIQSSRQTRPSLKALLRQKYLNGYWVGETVKLYPKSFSLYHYVPFVFLLAILVTAVFAGFGFWLLAALLWAAYGIVLIASTIAAFRAGGWNPYYFLLPVILFCLHLSYGAGTFVGLVTRRPDQKREKA
ncbi:MAG: glycosyltransferase family 2 protein [Clostridia bacterium]|nr:glycosyltransferase family 2 protein [Clostridia bacterium]